MSALSTSPPVWPGPPLRLPGEHWVRFWFAANFAIPFHFALQLAPPWLITSAVQVVVLYAWAYAHTVAHEVAHYAAAHRLGIAVIRVEFCTGPEVLRFYHRGVLIIARADPFRLDKDGHGGFVRHFASRRRWKTNVVTAMGPTSDLLMLGLAAAVGAGWPVIAWYAWQLRYQALPESDLSRLREEYALWRRSSR